MIPAMPLTSCWGGRSWDEDTLEALLFAAFVEFAFSILTGPRSLSTAFSLARRNGIG